MFVPISADDRQVVWHLAKARQVGKRAHVTNRRVSEAGDDDVEETGLLGEFAFARWAHQAVAHWPELRGDAGFDFRLSDAATLEIKSTTCRSGVLFVRDDQLARGIADVLTLAVVSAEGVNLAGWTLREEFHERARRRALDPSKPPVLSMTQGQLWDVEDLML